MGASISSSFSSFTTTQAAPTSSTTTTASQSTTSTKPTKKSTTTTTAAPLKTPSRRSRRITQTSPTKVNFKSTNLRNPTPLQKHTPLTPKSRAAYTSTKLTPARKSSRFTKFKRPKVAGAPKYSAKLSYELEEMVYCWERKVLYEGKVLRREGNKYLVGLVGSGREKWFVTDDMMGRDPKSNRYFREMWQRIQDEETGRRR